MFLESRDLHAVQEAAIDATADATLALKAVLAFISPGSFLICVGSVLESLLTLHPLLQPFPLLHESELNTFRKSKPGVFQASQRAGRELALDYKRISLLGLQENPGVEFKCSHLQCGEKRPPLVLPFTFFNLFLLFLFRTCALVLYV